MQANLEAGVDVTLAHLLCNSTHLDYLGLAVAEQRLPLLVGGIGAIGQGLVAPIGDVPCTDICAFLVLPFQTMCVSCNAMLQWLQRLHSCCC